MDNNIEIKIEVERIDLAISLCYTKENLTLEDIQSGFWYNNEINIAQVMSPFIKANNWNLLEEAMGYWVNDDFNECFPFKLIRDINEYRTDILMDTLKKTQLIITMNKIANKRYK
jgi:hypothetical protein